MASRSDIELPDLTGGKPGGIGGLAEDGAVFPASGRDGLDLLRKIRPSFGLPITLSRFGESTDFSDFESLFSALSEPVNFLNAMR
jgi:hypothetical protein